MTQKNSPQTEPKFRSSRSTMGDEDSQSPEKLQICRNLEEISEQQLCLEWLNEKIAQPQISEKLNAKAVLWLETNGWSHGMDFQSIILSITLYYYYKSRITIKKQKLSLILATCLFLSSKMIRAPELNLNQILQMISSDFQPSDLFEEEAKILWALDFNLNFSLPLLERRRLMDEQSYNKVCFFVEVLIIKDWEVVWRKQKLEKLIKWINGEEVKEFQELPCLLRRKDISPLIHKYNSKFEVEQIIKNYLN